MDAGGSFHGIDGVCSGKCRGEATKKTADENMFTPRRLEKRISRLRPPNCSHAFMWSVIEQPASTASAPMTNPFYPPRITSTDLLLHFDIHLLMNQIWLAYAGIVSLLFRKRFGGSTR
jgi:hypothetical protein